jgi:hypothetical protein
MRANVEEFIERYYNRTLALRVGLPVSCRIRAAEHRYRDRLPERKDGVF